MQRNEFFGRTDNNVDVYADVATTFGNGFSQQSNVVQEQETQEFSLASIQEKLGAFANVDSEANVGTPDVMPTTQTLNMNFERNYSSQSTARAKTDTRTKVAVASYTALVLCLVIAVTLCAVAVGNSFSNFVATDAKYSELLDQAQQLEGQLGVDNTAQLFEKATELGYVDASGTNTRTYERLETRPMQNLEVQTNWFDALRDWLFEVFGG